MEKVPARVVGFLMHSATAEFMNKGVGVVKFCAKFVMEDVMDKNADEVGSLVQSAMAKQHMRKS